jgi:hypothetical protein
MEFLLALESLPYLGGKQMALPCCDHSSVLHPECAAFETASVDTAYGRSITCLPYSRSVPAPTTKCMLGPRQQANLATSFLDASTIYGSTDSRARALREYRNGSCILLDG